MPNKFHSLLASRTQDSLLKKLNLSADEEQQLIDAAREIRSAIIQGFTALRERAKRDDLQYEIPEPKFAIQGSYIYGTLNTPAYPPQQQVDIDLGIYLPFSALGDGEQPKEVTTDYFQAVTQILQEHKRSNSKCSWILPAEEEQKPTCIRIIISEKTHIDLPLYAVPESELNRVTESQSRSSISGMIDTEDDLFTFLTNQDELFEEKTLEAVNPDVIYLAHRKDGWIPSDALVIRDWVRGQFRRLGSMIRPINRFLKAWRDEVWRSGGEPSSILLLAHSLRSFPQDSDGLTHCEALEFVINALPSIFNHPLLVPCPKSEDRHAKEDLCERISPEKKAEYLDQFRILQQQYCQAKNLPPENANQVLINIFGPRMPSDHSRIIVESQSDPTVKKILSSKPEVKPLYTTLRSNSG